MSTHAGLLMLNPHPTGAHDTWGYTHIHFDGYPRGLGSDLVDYHSSVQRVEALLAAGYLEYIRADKLAPHPYPSDQKEAQYFPSLEAVVAATDRGPDAFRYVWDGQRWYQLGEHVTLLPLRSIYDMTGVFGEPSE